MASFLNKIISRNDDDLPFDDPSAEPGQDEEFLANATVERLTHLQPSISSATTNLSGFDTATSMASRASQNASEAYNAAKNSASDASNASSSPSGFDVATSMASRASQSANEAYSAAKDSASDILNSSSKTDNNDVGLGHKIYGKTDYAQYKAGEAVDQAKDAVGLGSRK